MGQEAAKGGSRVEAVSPHAASHPHMRHTTEVAFVSTTRPRSLLTPSSPAPPPPPTPQRHKAVENITSWYMASLGAYRGLYVLNWAYRVIAEPHYRAWIPWVAGVIQTLFFADFLYYFYVCRIKLGMKAVILPQ